jgi:hypothetical protein
LEVQPEASWEAGWGINLLLEETIKMPKIFERKKGVICYELRVFHNRRAPLAELLRELLNSELDWLWKSMRATGDDTFDNPSLPDVRAWTWLVPGDAPLLLEDIGEENAESYGRGILLLGIDPVQREGFQKAANVRTALDQFAKEQGGPIRIAIAQVGDQKYEYVFVPHQVTDGVLRLVNLWNANEDYQTRPYRQLHAAKLETLVTVFNRQI